MSSDNDLIDDGGLPFGSTLPRPLGGETYREMVDAEGNRVTLTYNDLWTLIVCRSSLDGDWQRAREAAGMVPDPSRKRALVDKLSRLEQSLGRLLLPEDVMRLNQHRAHLWFNQRPVTDAKNW